MCTLTTPFVLLCYLLVLFGFASYFIYLISYFTPLLLPLLPMLPYISCYRLPSYILLLPERRLVSLYFCLSFSLPNVPYYSMHTSVTFSSPLFTPLPILRPDIPLTPPPPQFPLLLSPMLLFLLDNAGSKHCMWTSLMNLILKHETKWYRVNAKENILLRLLLKKTAA